MDFSWLHRLEDCSGIPDTREPGPPSLPEDKDFRKQVHALCDTVVRAKDAESVAHETVQNSAVEDVFRHPRCTANEKNRAFAMTVAANVLRLDRAVGGGLTPQAATAALTFAAKYSRDAAIPGNIRFKAIKAAVRPEHRSSVPLTFLRDIRRDALGAWNLAVHAEVALRKEHRSYISETQRERLQKFKSRPQQRLELFVAALEGFHDKKGVFSDNELRVLQKTSVHYAKSQKAIRVAASSAYPMSSGTILQRLHGMLSGAGSGSGFGSKGLRQDGPADSLRTLLELLGDADIQKKLLFCETDYAAIVPHVRDALRTAAAHEPKDRLLRTYIRALICSYEKLSATDLRELKLELRRAAGSPVLDDARKDDLHEAIVALAVVRKDILGTPEEIYGSGYRLLKTSRPPRPVSKADLQKSFLASTPVNDTGVRLRLKDAFAQSLRPLRYSGANRVPKKSLKRRMTANKAFFNAFVVGVSALLGYHTWPLRSGPENMSGRAKRSQLAVAPKRYLEDELSPTPEHSKAVHYGAFVVQKPCELDVEALTRVTDEPWFHRILDAAIEGSFPAGSTGPLFVRCREAGPLDASMHYDASENMLDFAPGTSHAALRRAFANAYDRMQTPSSFAFRSLMPGAAERAEQAEVWGSESGLEAIARPSSGPPLENLEDIRSAFRELAGANIPSGLEHRVAAHLLQARRRADNISLDRGEPSAQATFDKRTLALMDELLAYDAALPEHGCHKLQTDIPGKDCYQVTAGKFAPAECIHVPAGFEPPKEIWRAARVFARHGTAPEVVLLGKENTPFLTVANSDKYYTVQHLPYISDEKMQRVFDRAIADVKAAGISDAVLVLEGNSLIETRMDDIFKLAAEARRPHNSDLISWLLLIRDNSWHVEKLQ